MTHDNLNLNALFFEIETKNSIIYRITFEIVTTNKKMKSNGLFLENRNKTIQSLT
jgi:hypothetical protein